FATVRAARATEPALPSGTYRLLTVGGSGLRPGTRVDPRFPGNLPDGPFDITRYISYHDYAEDPTHRFFQMWQETDCDLSRASPDNPSGCQNDLFPWVEATAGSGSNGKPQPAGYGEDGHHEGAIAMGFYNVQTGDAGYFDRLAHEYALSDNYHQAVMGGTGVNHIAIGYGTAMYYAGANGQPAVPPSNQIENPDPQPGTDNFYSQDGYRGGSYVECADRHQPGVRVIRKYLGSLPYPAFRQGDCRRGAYYLVNNYNPGYLGTGTPAPLGADRFTVPPSRQPNLGLLLSDHHVSWGYYGEGWNGGTERGENGSYCTICDPFLYSTQIMTDPGLRANLHGIRDLYAVIHGGTLPAVSIVKPDGYLDGHPASSKFELFEAFSRKIIERVKANPALWKDTAIMITVDEGGGYYDSGYIQPIDFFGDGTRIPLLVVSRYSRGVGMVHTYADHVSFDKFVEANWGLPPISARSRDNLPDPVTTRRNPYVPINSPAIGDLMTMFHFSRD
ncbi:MAG: alkaline phosphatase family protein, partial [Acidiferrobacterales bacterium]